MLYAFDECFPLFHRTKAAQLIEIPGTSTLVLYNYDEVVLLQKLRPHEKASQK